MTRLMPGEDTLSRRAAPPTLPVIMIARMTSIWRSVSMCMSKTTPATKLSSPGADGNRANRRRPLGLGACHTLKGECLRLLFRAQDEMSSEGRSLQAGKQRLQLLVGFTHCAKLTGLRGKVTGTLTSRSTSSVRIRTDVRVAPAARLVVGSAHATPAGPRNACLLERSIITICCFLRVDRPRVAEVANISARAWTQHDRC